MFIEDAILLAYAITVISETIIILTIQQPKEVLWWIFGVFLINSLTHPFVIYFLHVENLSLSYIPVELGVFAVEAFWYRLAFSISWKRSLVISGVANTFSIFVGFGIRLWII